MTSPWLTLIMPVHNGAAWLGETLESVAAEQAEGIELLIFDSSPNSDCAAIAESYSDRLQIQYSHCPDILPWTAKTNLAVAESRAPFVSMLHQDDLWLPGRAAAAQAAIWDWPEAALLLNPSRIIDAQGKALGTWRCPLRASAPLSGAEVAEQLLVQNFIAIPAPIIRRDAWLAAGGMDEALWYTADWDLYLKLIRQGPLVYSSQPTTAFRIHADSLTVTGSRDQAGFLAQMKLVIERHSDLIPGDRRSKVLKTAFASAYINGALAAAARGECNALASAAKTLLGLNPFEALRYFRASRLIERVWPRLRARLAGSF